ncbi:S-methyl-5-thioribose-1-phosphate isomerase [Fictibacillus terranigra]|uniref:Methylthioribose-1-phosphate isomerase n=1 Tax=Fictibacillus terranigra TaxID=3058424 RepID=A0ABT8E780_9BACL|nr:S-methyl-5-thioribose-1-phosphate isomerase [Fictibacillus sp. CENA-BCM004]MDN4073756.1 S-methyl-5-thioribose-1-phosphate isomerase [Fictibacillus sp. CENA-BCM004]
MSTTETWISSLRYKGDHLLLLDQQQLPHHTVYINVTTIEQVWECIKKLQVRGAPAIGIAAAFGIVLWAKANQSLPYDEFKSELLQQKNYLAGSRPTAVNLFWALDRVTGVAIQAGDTEEAVQLIEQEALLIQQEDEEICRKIGVYALTLLKNGDRLMTHCNAGGIATARYGTALAPMYLAKEKGWNLSVFANETRPVFQGARLTAWELQQAGIDVTLITDNMAAHTLKTKNIAAVIVGCDRIAANGDTANKIGTFGLALQAKALGIPFYVASPLSTIDLNTPAGEDIPIEERPAEEVTHFQGTPIAPEGIKVFNPSFDVTPHEYITAIITEEGIASGNYKEQLKEFFNTKK